MRRAQLVIGFLGPGMAIGALALLSGSWIARGGAGLDGVWAHIVNGLTQSGSSRIAPLLLLGALVAWALDPECFRARRGREVLVLFVLMAVFLPAIGLLNEHAIKSAFARPRPSHVRLLEAGVLADLDTFYRLDRDTRRGFLASRWAEAEDTGETRSLHLHPVVVEHWIEESGYTFPSGHTLNAFAAAVLFLWIALARPTRLRRLLAGTLLVWATGVGWSRTLLGVHGAVDVVAGAVSGGLLGVVLFVTWWRWTREPGRPTERLES